MDQHSEIKKIFEQHGGILRTAQMERFGIYYRKMKKLLDNGEIEMVRRGYYQYVDERAFSDVPALVKLFPDGIFCMESALDYYGYSKRTPLVWHIAVDSKSSRRRFYIDYPCVKPHFILTGRLLVGVDQVEIDGVEASVYNRDRTICDCLLHRNKMDAEVFNFAVHCYLQDEKKNRAQLAEYAKLLHIEKKVREVLGAWL